jgi:hypothetical protein
MSKMIASVAAWLLLFPVLTNAYDVDTDKYFAYLERPGRYQGGVTSPGQIFLLSKTKCSAKGAPKSARLGTIVLIAGFERETPACWYKEDSNGQQLVVLCSTLQNEMDAGAGSCHFISPTRFIDVRSLPRSANF